MVVGYIEPGTYITELYKPKATVPPGVGFNLVLVGTGKKEKKIVNELVVRGKIYDEALTVAGTSPHTAPLLNDSDQKKGNTTLYKDGAILPASAYSFDNEAQITIADPSYSATSVYTIDYVAVDSFVDTLANAISRISNVGLYRNSGNYKENVDFEVSGSDLDWTIITPAAITGSEAGPFNMSTKDKIKLSIDGRAPITVTITGALQTAVVVAEVVADINTALNADPAYGADYATAASVSSGKVKITSPNLDPTAGSNSIVMLYSTGADSALELVMGAALEEAGAPYEFRGAGKRPVPGTQYYATYFIERPDADYNVGKQFLNDTDFYDDIGYPEVGNDLANAGEIAWGQGILSLFVVQVKDGDDDGIYTDSDYVIALNTVQDSRSATDIVCLRSTEIVRAEIKSLVEMESAQLKSNYKRYWIGVARDTVLGDIDTASSMVFIASQEMEVNPDSPARGRFIVVGPANYTRSFVDVNGITQSISVDSNFMAVLLAAKTVAFERASDSLFGKTFSGLTIDDPFTDGEKRFAASNGIFVIYADGGVLKVYDSLTTDNSGDARYEEPSASTQKDNVAFKMLEAVDEQLRGIVPDDPIDFIGSIKSVVGGVLLASIETGDIGYYTNDDGTVRDLDYTVDITAWRSGTDPRAYNFRYYFNAKYPAKRFFGEFTVDVPF